MHYIIVFLINFFALNCRLWLFQSAFQRKQKKWLAFILVVIMWLISACSILAYPMILKYIGSTTFSIASLSRQTITFLICYVGAIWLILTVFWKKLSAHHKLIVRSIMFLTLAAAIAVGTVSLPVWAALYFLCAAGSEEFLKFSVGQTFFSQYQISPKDLILFTILSAIGFSIIENIVYLINNPSIGLAISRSISTIIMHVIFTWVIAYIITTRGQKNLWRYIIAFLSGMALHRGYNTLISHNNPLITIIMVILWYFVVSYFLYKSDRLYLVK